jgi:DNA repair exonuclease SbcCD ATPase subunit
MNDEIIKNLAQSYANANVRIEQLEHENAELRRDVYQCPPTSENSYEGLKWADAFDVIERDNAELHNKVTALKHENLALREELRQSEDRFRNIPDEVWSKADLVEMTNKALEERDDAHKQIAALREQIAALGEIAVLNYDDATVGKCDAITGDGEKYKDVMRRLFVDQPRENAELRADKERLDWLERRTAFFQLFRKDGVVFVQLVGETGPHECTSTRAAIDAARAKEGKP